MSIGEVLRNARIKKGYSFEYLEEATKIRAKYLEALEKENFAVLPGQVYAKAFLRTYAKFLELDTEEIMNEFSQINNEAPPEVEKDKHEAEPTDTGSKKWRYVAAGVALISLLAFNALYNIGDRPEDNKPELPKTVQQPPAENPNNIPPIPTRPLTIHPRQTNRPSRLKESG
ncbi:helix-turn-helix domain-containing protein [Desulforamulus profundi]|uniref:helix-turn-helix domain-containing protein n=1 Tax=Desulforamulus profundi TaxID=1383067 RepID=UPI001EE5E906|nr:helix-turn-helix domain-containing protein [Desulforamulus profundi]